METPIAGATGPDAMGVLSTTSPVGDYNLKSLTFASRTGGWLFRQRTWLPVPLVAALLLIPPPRHTADALPLLGALIVILGETIRLWAVLHIGAISRTRSDRLSPLVVSGPFAYVRNPLYLGNILLWMGFAIAARLLWLTPLIVLLLALEYHAIVRWEEQLLEARLGESYARYARQVPRWLPARTTHSSNSGNPGAAFSWKQTLFSERGTLIAIAVGFLLLWIKARF
jgi:protein-S-isoprenylcysteine O-methyltransferase Ste14